MKNTEFTLIKGIELTENQRNLLKFKGMAKESWVKSHSFWFKDNKPASYESGYYYPVCH